MKKGFTLAEGTLERSQQYSNSKYAFTLAEVLITLGVIGVVAALTIPTLIANHRKTVVETRLAKFYTTMNQAVQRAEVDYGDKRDWDKYERLYQKDENGKNDLTKPAAENREYFDKYFAPYIIANKIEGSPNGLTVVYFSDGSVASFAGTSIHFYPDGKNYKQEVIDEETGKFVNDMKNSGIKVFTFLFGPSETKTTKNQYYYDKGIEPYKYNWDGTREMLLEDSNIGCKESVTNERAYCTALIQMNGWKIPKDYPLRF